MPNAAIKSQAEFAEGQGNALRETAIEGLRQGREGFDKLHASLGLGSILASTSILVKGWTELNAKSFQAAKTNSELTLDFADALAKAKNLSDVAALPASHADKQLQALSGQAKEISSLARRIVDEAFQPFKSPIEIGAPKPRKR